MIVDTSALVAVLRGENDAEQFIAELVDSNVPKRLSAASYVELGIVIDRTGDPVIRSRLDDLIESIGISVEPVTME